MDRKTHKHLHPQRVGSFRGTLLNVKEMDYFLECLENLVVTGTLEGKRMR